MTRKPPSASNAAPVAERLAIFLLGGFRVQIGEREIPDSLWHLRKSKSLVKLLALTPEHRLHREQVMDVLWRDLDAEAASHNLHQALYVARRVLESNPQASTFLTIQDEFLTLAPAARLWIDAEAFESAASRARASREPSDYRAALEIYHGDLLPEDLYEDWTHIHRDALRAEYHNLLTELAARYQEQNNPSAAIDTLKIALANDPTDEETHQALMRLYTRGGQRALALRQYQNLREAFQRELDAKPSPESNQLYQEILDSAIVPVEKRSGTEISSAAPFLPALLPRPVPLVGEDEREIATTNLRAPLTTFIGREKEIAEVKRLLTTTRLLTLTGSGGSGKTRLALEVARQVADRYSHGVWMVELASLQDPSLAVNTVVAALGIVEQSGVDLEFTLKEFLKNKNLLLVLDSCEHLIAACAKLAENLLSACANLQLLATTLEPMHLQGELTWRVPSLAVPDPRQKLAVQTIESFDAVRLFVERGRQVQPEFELNAQTATTVVQICARLDGIPLALELAAARVSVLPVEQIAAHLDDRFQLLTANTRAALPRQQTLRATMDWSYDLLIEAAKILWQRLSVFQAGFTLEAVDAVTRDSAFDGMEMLDLVSRLVDRSIIVTQLDQPQARYRLLESVKAYGLEKLRAAGDEEKFRRRHRDYYLRFAQSATVGLQTSQQGDWLARLESESDDLRAALEWSKSDTAGNEGYLSLCGALWAFWYIHGDLSEGRRWLDEALNRRAGASTLAQANILGGAGLLAFAQGDFPNAEKYCREGLTLFEQLGHAVGQALCHFILGLIAQYQGDFERAKNSHEQAMKLVRVGDNKFGMGLVLHLLGVVAYHQGDYPRARRYLEEAMAVRRAIGDQWGWALTLHNLANVVQEEGNLSRAQSLNEESLALARQVGSKIGVAYALVNLGLLAYARGEFDSANKLLLESLGLFETVDDKPGIARNLRNLGQVALAQGNLDQARPLYRGSLALHQQLGEKHWIASSLEGLASIALAENHALRACRLLGAAEALREQTGAAMTRTERENFERVFGALRTQLDNEAFAELWTEGRAMTIDDAVMYGLQDE